MPMTLRMLSILLAPAVAAIAACSQEKAPADANGAETNAAVPVAPPVVQLIDASGKSIGSVTMSEDPNGVTVKLAAAGLPAGVHGVHLHEAGRCDTPDFKSAGAHWNPADKKHGRDNPEGAHLGDLANFDVAAAGESSTTFLIGGVSYGAGPQMLADADGTSIVVHAKADDYKTDPSGESGDRIACAILAPPQSSN
jgi:Cu-Zn family superoxide dismutase